MKLRVIGVVMRKRDIKIFEDHDTHEAKDMLKAMLIQIILKDNITFERFSQLHREYHLEIGTPIDKIPSHRNNLIRAITQKDVMTYRMFQYILKNILGYNLTNISMTLRDRENNIHLLSMDRITF